jgi:hypothetical protein
MVVSKVIIVATICTVIIITSSDTINTGENKAISKIGISKTVSGNMMTTAGKNTGATPRSGNNAISKTDTATVIITISKTGTIHLINRGNGVLLTG